jgi:hypothetical protein
LFEVRHTLRVLWRLSGRSVHSTPNGELGLNYLCAGYKLFFKHIDQPMQLMVRLLRQSRVPAEPMRLYAERDQKWQELWSKTGRNGSVPVRQRPEIQELSRA